MQRIQQTLSFGLYCPSAKSSAAPNGTQRIRHGISHGIAWAERRVCLAFIDDLLLIDHRVGIILPV